MIIANATVLNTALPNFVRNALANALCVQVYTDSSEFSGNLVNSIISEFPVIFGLVNTSMALNICRLVIVFAAMKPFTPPYSHNYLTILMTGSELPPNSTMLPSIYRHRNFFWISGLFSTAKIHNFHNNDDLREMDESYATKVVNEMLSSSPTWPNFHGKNLRVRVANHSLYALATTDGNETSVTGFDYSSIDFSCSFLNLKPAIEMSRIGVRIVNRSSEDLINYIVNDEADVSVGGIELAGEDVEKTEFINPWELRCDHFLVPRPKHMEYSFSAVFTPFEPDLWIAVGFIVLIEGCARVSIARAVNESAFKSYMSIGWSFFTSAMHLILRYYPKGSENRGAMRPLFVSWTWMSFLMVSLYTSQLAAIFVTPRYENKRTRAEEFYDNGYYWGGQLEEVFGKSELMGDEISAKTLAWLTERYVPENNVSEREERMDSGKYIVPGESVAEVFFFYLHIPGKEYVRKYEAAGNCYYTFYTAPMFPRGSPYTKIFNRVVGYLRAAGIKQALKRRMLRHPGLRKFIADDAFTFTKSNKTKGFNSLSLGRILFPFHFLCVGLSISLLVFISELTLGSKRKKFAKKSPGCSKSTKYSSVCTARRRRFHQTLPYID
ncbi:Glutamate receptor, ionotropic [Nesidiocoris tenuis]|uniref:Glutamate receptor, ionotropic n=1 Tax=Nesidiocoris tenuis TaxID=355587 RepID=A0ABN7AA61_9HEMI|nr:Glutamate receptor, ionotropic [Nesidiocoris tenuis]